MLETMTGIPKVKLHFKYSPYYLIQHIYRSMSISVLHYSTMMTYNTELPSRYLRKKNILCLTTWDFCIFST